MKINKNDVINFNVDYIEVFGTLKDYKIILSGIDDDNSNFRNYKGFTLEKTENLKNYQFKITFWKDDTPIFAWYRGDTLNIYIETKDYFTVYGSTFSIMSLSEIIDFINENIVIDYGSQYYINSINKRLKDKRDNNLILKRVDLCIDIIKPIKDVVYNFRKLNSKGSKFYDDKGNIQTYYIGEKKNTLNKNLLIRVYDKIADIKHKEKQFLFPAYLKEDYITRIEVEFRVEMLRFLKLEQLLDRSYIFGLFTSYIKKHTKIFDNLKYNSVTKLQKINNSITLDDLNYNQITKSRYKNTFVGYSKKILGLGSCPVDLLLREGIISEITKTDIGLSTDNNKFDLIKYVEGVTKRNLRYIFANNDENRGIKRN